MVKQFTLYRPGSNQRDKNLSNVACTITEINGVAHIQMSMLKQEIGTLRIGYDGTNLIVVLRDNSEGLPHVLSLTPEE
jgi:hypothetical protein